MDSIYPRAYVEGHLYWVKAKILAWEGNDTGAVEYVDKLKHLEQTDYYDKKNEAEEIDAQYRAWKKKQSIVELSYVYEPPINKSHQQQLV